MVEVRAGTFGALFLYLLVCCEARPIGSEILTLSSLGGIPPPPKRFLE